LPEALARAWQRTVETAGSDPERWRWAAHHQTNAQHPLVARFSERAATLNPPRAAIGGDSDTIQAGTYLWAERPNFDITSLSVYRQMVNCADIAHSSYAIPGGVSGVPASPHYADQLDLWRTHQRIPMRYTPAEVQHAAVDTLTLTPA
jgi:penicillin amidase